MYASQEFCGDKFVVTPVQNSLRSQEIVSEFPNNYGYQNNWSAQHCVYQSSPVVHPPPPPGPPPPPPTYEMSITRGLLQAHTAPNESQATGKPEKPKRVRTAFTPSQLVELENMFRRSSYVSRPDRIELSTRLGLKDRAIKVWFQNRRMKQKKEGVGVQSSSAGSSPARPEVGSSTTDFSTEMPLFQINENFPKPINYNPSFASPKAEEIFNRAVFEYENAHKKQSNFNQYANNFTAAQSRLIVTPQYDNVSTIPQYTDLNYSSNANAHSTPYAELPDSTSPAIDGTSTLVREIEPFAFQNNSGLPSMIDNDTLDELGKLVSQCITSEVFDVTS